VNIFGKKDFLIYFIFGLLFIASALVADYGHRVDQFPYYQDIKVDTDNVGNALERNSLNSTDLNQIEEPNKWLMRYRLYSVDADEVNNIMALARINPGKFEFDPHHYSYGGGYLYPLGVWFYALNYFNIIQVGDLNWIVENPDEMDKIYHAGRIFVLLSFFISMLFLFHAIRLLQTLRFAFIVSLIYLTIPSVLMFSLVMKPHVYSLLWVNIGIFLLVRSYSLNRFNSKDATILGLTIGMAVGSIITFAGFAIIIWNFLAFLFWKRRIKFNNLIIVPLFAIITFFLVNPYIILNYEAFFMEGAAQKSWFFVGLNIEYFWFFIINSLLPGLGIGFLGLFGYILFSSIFFPKIQGQRFIGFNVFLIILFVSIISASVSSWHINSRYIFYLIPLVLASYAFLASSSTKILSIVFLMTSFHFFPLFLAYYDEDNLNYSTRLQSAKWINNNISKDKTVCTSGRSIAPYDSPPFDFFRIKVDREKCDFFISIERQVDQVFFELDKALIKRFEPRLNFKAIPLVYSHINPQISIYENN